MNQTPSKLIFVVVCTFAILASCCVLSLCAALFLHVYAAEAIVTAFLSTTTGLIGYLSGVLTNTRTSQPQEGTTSSTTTTATIVPVPPTPPIPPPITPPEPLKDQKP